MSLKNESASTYRHWPHHTQGDVWELMFSMEDLGHYRIKDGFVSRDVK